MKTYYQSLFFVFLIFCLNGSAQSIEDVPQAVKQFYNLQYTINDRAPEEVAQFGQLSGVWYCIQSKYNQESQEFEEDSRAYWAWKYILDGFCVQDFWYQGEKETPYYKFFKRDLMLTQLRVYDPVEKIWNVAFINNNNRVGPGSVFGLFKAYAKGDEVIMEFEPQEPENYRRITFYDINDETFEWKAEQSKDEGKTWNVTWKISAKKIYD